MRRFPFLPLAALFLFCVPRLHATGAITKVAADCTGTSSCTTTGNAIGDIELAVATRDLTTTAASTPAGWTAVASGSINGTSTADSVMTLFCKIATGTSEASGTFTNATHVNIQVYRGQVAGNTAACTNTSAILGTAFFFTSTINTTTTTETFNAVTNFDLNSWDVGFGFCSACTAGIGTAPTGMTNRTSNTIATSPPSNGGHDTNGGVTKFATQNVTLTTAGRIITVVVEIKAACTSGICFSASQFGTVSSAGTTITNLSGTINVPSGSVVVVASGTNDTTSTINTITDGASNSLTQCASALKHGTNNTTDIWVKANATANATATFTVTWSASSNARGMKVFVYTGADTTSPCETASNAGTLSNNTTLTSGSFSPAASGNTNVMYAVFGTGETTVTPSGNYSIRGTDNGNDASYSSDGFDLSGAASGAQTAGFTVGTTTNLVLSVVSIKPPAAAGATCVGATLLLMHAGCQL